YLGQGSGTERIAQAAEIVRYPLESAVLRRHRGGMIRLPAMAALTLLALLAACGSGEQEPVEAQRFSLEAVRRMPPEPLLSPDTKAASWTVTADGQAIDFGLTGEKPMMTLACDLRAAPARD